jgi:hypothetical protein
MPAMLPLVLFAYVNDQIAGVDLSILSFITFFGLFGLYGMLKYFRRNEFVYLSAFLAMTTIFGSISIYFVEPGNPDANIINFGDALWWSISTMTTVAYSDVYPVTVVGGKVISVILMFAGIRTLWAFVAAVSSKLVAERIEGKDARSKTAGQSSGMPQHQRIVPPPMRMKAATMTRSWS